MAQGAAAEAGLARLRIRARAPAVFCAGATHPAGRAVGRSTNGELLVAGRDGRIRRIPAGGIDREEAGRVVLALSPAQLERCPGYVPDPDLVEAVRRSLERWSPLRNLGLAGIQINAREGRGILSGHVPTEVIRSRALELAGRTWGVLAVEDRMISDEALVEAVTAALARCPELQPSRVRVSCYLGRVTLAGQLETPEQAELARSQAAAVSGVVAVRDLIEIVPGAG